MVHYCTIRYAQFLSGLLLLHCSKATTSFPLGAIGGTRKDLPHWLCAAARKMFLLQLGAVSAGVDGFGGAGHAAQAHAAHAPRLAQLARLNYSILTVSGKPE